MHKGQSTSLKAKPKAQRLIEPDGGPKSANSSPTASDFRRLHRNCPQINQNIPRTTLWREFLRYKSYRVHASSVAAVRKR